MSRYGAIFERVAQLREGAFGAFLMLGDPDLETSARRLDALVEGGADMIEVGIPFSDPVADGPVIQAAAQFAHSTLPEDRPPGTPFAAPVPVADDLAELDRLAAFLGRTP